MMFGHVIASEHSIKRYKERILSRKSEVKDDSRSAIIKMILRDVSYRNIKEMVTFGDKYKFVFTNNNCEFRFEKSYDGKSWVLLTVIKYRKMFAFEEYQTLEEFRALKDSKDSKHVGAHTAINLRKEQKEKYENGWCVNGKRDLVRDLVSN